MLLCVVNLPVMCRKWASDQNFAARLPVRFISMLHKLPARVHNPAWRKTKRGTNLGRQISMLYLFWLLNDLAIPGCVVMSFSELLKITKMSKYRKW